jgi:hypothetical protein
MFTHPERMRRPIKMCRPKIFSRSVWMRFFALTLIALVIAGCGGRASMPAWQRVAPGHQYTGKLGFTADLPAGWMSYEEISAYTLLLTRHSTPMDFVHIKRFPLSTPLQYTELTLNAGMRAYELAKIVVHNLRATPGIFDLTVEELAPGEIDGREAFRLTMSYAMENGMRRRSMVYGFISGNSHYNEIGLYALEDYYFDAVLEDFQALVGSFRVRS